MSKTDTVFKEQFNAVKKLISFSTRWLEGSDFRRIVVDRNDRLMLEVGETIKSVDKHGRQYIAVGTPFGIVAIQRRELMGNTVLMYEVTKNLVDAYSNREGAKFFNKVSGLLPEHGLQYMFNGMMQDDLAVIAKEMQEAGKKVCDGIMPRREKKADVVKTKNPNQEIWDNALKKIGHKLKKQQRQPVKIEEPNMKPGRGQTSCIMHLDDAGYTPDPEEVRSTRRARLDQEQMQMTRASKSIPYVEIQPATA